MKATGVLRAAGASKWRAERLLILGYHGVSIADEHLWDPELFLSPAVFASRMEQLHAQGATVLPLHEALDRLRAGTLPPRAVVLTFDDGFYNFHRVAWPILQRYQFPATVYQTTYYCQYPEPICNLVWRYMLWKAGPRQLALSRITGEHTVVDLASSRGRRDAFEALFRFAAARNLSGAGRNELARAVANDVGIDYDALRRSRLLGLMNPAEVREVSAAGVGIELHTHRHRTPLDRRLFLREIDDNRAWIEDVTGVPPRHFCYPSGQWNRAFFPWLTERGVLSATTCEQGLVTPAAEHLLLPRLIDTSSCAPIEFEGWIAGPGSLLQRPSF
jgi:peptidoglycan/xylan/chitin deacetylase (PgdA/CDA1 family)